LCRTKGGCIFDVRVLFEERETPHRVIMGREYYEDFDLKPEQTLDRAFAYLIGKKVQRQTEGRPSASCSDLPMLLGVRHTTTPFYRLSAHQFWVGWAVKVKVRDKVMCIVL